MIQPCLCEDISIFGSNFHRLIWVSQNLKYFFKRGSFNIYLYLFCSCYGILQGHKVLFVVDVEQLDFENVSIALSIVNESQQRSKHFTIA